MASKRKEFCLDLDGCGFRFIEALRDSIIYTTPSFRGGTEYNKYMLPDPKNWECWIGWGMDKEDWVRYFDKFVKLGGFKASGYAEAGFLRVVKELHKNGHGIHFLTARGAHSSTPPEDRVHIQRQTAEWLAELEIPYDSLLFSRHKSLFNADVFLDDSPQNIIDLQAAGKNVIVFDQLYNQHVDCPRVSSWEEFYQKVTGEPTNREEGK